MELTVSTIQADARGASYVPPICGLLHSRLYSCSAEKISTDDPKNPIGFIWGNQKVEV